MDNDFRNPENDLSFFDTSEIFTYKKLPIDMMPTSMEVIHKSYPFPETNGVLYSYFAHYGFSTRFLNKDFLRLLEDAGLYAKHAEIFYRPGTGEDMDAFIHVDGHEIIPGLAKINFIIGGKGNVMRWWKPLIPISDENKLITKAGTQYLAFEERHCELIDEVEMSDGLYVVNAGIPHSVTMNRGDIDNPRICISVVPRLIEKDAPINTGCWDAYTRLVDASRRFASKNN